MPGNSRSSLTLRYDVVANDQAGRKRNCSITKTKVVAKSWWIFRCKSWKRKVAMAGEFPYTTMVDDQKILALMTLGTHPEESV